MRQGYHSENLTDKNGNPAGGFARSDGIDIRWQSGPVKDVGGVNGAFVETLIDICVKRLRFYQSHFPCRENELAIQKLEEAGHWLDQRTRDRETRGVEGTHQK